MTDTTPALRPPLFFGEWKELPALLVVINAVKKRFFAKIINKQFFF
jgi:hypothetical protein